MRKPRQSAIRERTADELAELAKIAVYVGSAEHKDKQWWDGQPMAHQLPGGQLGREGKQKTTICPLTSLEDRDRATQWVKSAIREGKCKFLLSDKVFPKKIWYEAEGQIWMGLRVLDIQGWYKGWPVDEVERDEVFR